MSKFIIKLTHKKQDYYLEWSTVVDAPSTYGMPLEEFKQYYRDEYGRGAMVELEERLARVEQNGTSKAYGDDRTVDYVVRNNRAGTNERRLSKASLIKRYCLERPPGQWR